MKNRTRVALSALASGVMLFAVSGQILAQAADALTDGIYIIFDASNSMWGELPDQSRKIEVAKNVLNEFVGGDFSGRELALRIYGQNRPGDCSDTSLVVPFSAPGDVVRTMRDEVAGVTPRGRTPISRSLQAALEDFGGRTGDILLISDGIETCDADPCALMEEWRASGVDIRVHVVGFGLDDVAREAMTCVAETSGARYYDADSADGLAAALTEARQAALTLEPSPPPAAGIPAPVEIPTSPELRIAATDDMGRALSVEGNAVAQGGEPVFVASNRRNEVEPGTYTVEVGVPTANGTVYMPVTREITISEPGVTQLAVVVPRPATVRALFLLEGEQVDGALIEAFRGGNREFNFRWFDEVFAEPGDYEFRTQPNADNALSVTASLNAGEDTEIVFDMTRTVHVAVSFLLTGGEAVRRNSELWRDGVQIYDVHSNNGGRVRPGIYELRSPAPLTSIAGVEIVITGDAEQQFEIPIDTGFLTISYDPSGAYRTNPDRAFISPEGTNQRTFSRLGEAIAVTPGVYTITGWANAGDFEPVTVTVAEGDTVPVVLGAP